MTHHPECEDATGASPVQHYRRQDNDRDNS